jgi:hypothetical protein
MYKTLIFGQLHYTKPSYIIRNLLQKVENELLLELSIEKLTQSQFIYFVLVVYVTIITITQAI